MIRGLDFRGQICLCQLKAAPLPQNNITSGKNYTARLPFLTVFLKMDWPENTAEHMDLALLRLMLSVSKQSAWFSSKTTSCCLHHHLAVIQILGLIYVFQCLQIVVSGPVPNYFFNGGIVMLQMYLFKSWLTLQGQFFKGRRKRKSENENTRQLFWDRCQSSFSWHKSEQ